MIRRFVLLLVLAGGLGACSLPGTKQDELLTTVRSYENTLRWGMIQRAYEYVKADPDNPVEPPAGLDQIRITGYEQISPVLPAGEKRYTVTAQIRYVHLDRQVERTILDRQYWEWDEKGKRWVRANAIPSFQ